MNEFVIRAIHQYLTDELNLSQAEACQALLFESYRTLRGIASWTPASAVKHPFTKALGATSKSVVARWWRKSAGSPVSQKCPDIALRPPCPFDVVFEAKYFRKGGIDAARTALVAGIYQCFFYLGLPRAEETKKHAAWDYDFACFLVYDATDAGSLLSAWKDVDPEVKRGCWEGANIFAMILPANG